MNFRTRIGTGAMLKGWINRIKEKINESRTTDHTPGQI